MKLKQNLFYYIALGTSIIGILLSIALIQEYYGAAIGLAESICRAGAGINTCRTVANSAFSAIRNLPIIGDIPIAIFGLVLYGLIAFIFLKIIRTDDEEIIFTDLVLTLMLSSLAVIADIALFLISQFIIKTYCNLCTMTYFVTCIIFMITLILLVNLIKKPQIGGISKMKNIIFKNILSNSLKYGIIVIVLFTGGVAVGKYSEYSMIKYISKFSSNKNIIKIIKNYEKTKELEINLKDTPMAGDKKAPITIVLFSDFTCDHCAHAGNILKKILKEYSGKVKIYFKNLPLAGDCRSLDKGRGNPDAGACIAASAAICAHRQNKFMPVYSGLHEINEQGFVHTVDLILKLAASKNLNMKQFTDCFDSREVWNRISKEAEECERLGIYATPAIFINNKMLPSRARNSRVLRALINYIMEPF